MTLRLQKLDTKIEKLLQRRQKIQQDYTKVLFNLLSDTLQKGGDIQVLTGIVLNV